MTMKDSRKKNLQKLAVITLLWFSLVFVLAALSVWVFSGSGFLGSPAPAMQDKSISHEAAPPKGVEKEIVTIDLNGKWSTTIKETTFNVDVTNSVITIKMSKNGSSMLYWYGTFPSTGTIGEIITSTKLDINKAVLSGADSKMLTVKDGSLTFDVSAMGQTKNVEVTRV